jgi:hypothetical protein
VVVSKKVLQLILQKHATFSEEVSRLEQDHAFRTRVQLYSIIHRPELNRWPSCFIFACCSWRNHLV